MKLNRRACIVVLCFGLESALAQDNPAARAAHEWRVNHERGIVLEFFNLLSIPNLPSENSSLQKNADAIRQILEKRGVKTRLLEAGGVPPAVYGEILTPHASRTVVFYAHYDGQPLDPKEWAINPFTPALYDKALEAGGRAIPLPAEGKPFNPEWRIYGRSTSDDKAPIIAIAAALDALRASRINPDANIKFVFEGEEEAGSVHLDKIIAGNKELLRSDVWLICDGPVHQSRRQQIVFGARGITEISITVYGPRRELHSGHYGNWAPNPAMMLAHLLASMKDDDGRVLVEHYYDGIEPLSETERRAIDAAPPVDEELKRELWLGRTEGGGKKLVELLNLPSLNVRGMGSSRIGNQASNVVPSTATATIDMRLVKGISPQQARERVLAHIRRQGYFITDRDPSPQVLMAHPKVAKITIDPGYPATRTSMDLPISKMVIRAAEGARGPVVKLPTMGGSVPLFMIEEILNVPTITVPIANHDNNQHSFNENIRLQNLWDGIDLMAALLAIAER